MGSFFVSGGPVLASCQTPLTWKALSCLYFGKWKSKEHIASDLFGYTAPTAKRRMCPCCSLHLEQNFYPWLLNSGDILQWRCLNKDLVVVLSSLHMNRNKLKGSESFNRPFYRYGGHFEFITLEHIMGFPGGKHAKYFHDGICHFSLQRCICYKFVFVFKYYGRSNRREDERV